MASNTVTLNTVTPITTTTPLTPTTPSALTAIEAQQYLYGYLSARGYIDKTSDGWYSLGVRHDISHIVRLAGIEYRVDPGTLTQYVKEFPGATVKYDSELPSRVTPKNVIVLPNVVDNVNVYLRGAFDACGKKESNTLLLKINILTPGVHSMFLEYVRGINVPYKLVSRDMCWTGIGVFEILYKLTESTSLVRESTMDMYREVAEMYGDIDANAKFVKLLDDAVPPYRKSPADAGWDLSLVAIAKTVGDVTVFRTGIAVAPPPGYYFEMVPRSSVWASSWTLANNVGVIDAGYRGECLVALRWCGSGAPSHPPYPWRAVQLLLRKSYITEFDEVQSLDETARADTGGLGSKTLVNAP